MIKEEAKGGIGDTWGYAKLWSVANVASEDIPNREGKTTDG